MMMGLVGYKFFNKCRDWCLLDALQMCYFFNIKITFISYFLATYLPMNYFFNIKITLTCSSFSASSFFCSISCRKPDQPDRKIVSLPVQLHLIMFNNQSKHAMDRNEGRYGSGDYYVLAQEVVPEAIRLLIIDSPLVYRKDFTSLECAYNIFYIFFSHDLIDFVDIFGFILRSL